MVKVMWNEGTYQITQDGMVLRTEASHEAAIEWAEGYAERLGMKVLDLMR